MPIDARIPLGVQPFQPFDITRGAMQGAQLKRMAAISEQEQREAERLAKAEATREQVKAVLGKYQGDIGSALPEIYAIDPDTGMKIQKTWNDSRESDFNLKTAKLGHDKIVAQEVGRKAQGVTDQESYGYFLANLKASGLPTEGMPPTFDPAYVESLKTKSLTVLENASLEEKRLTAEYTRWKGEQDLKDKAVDNDRQEAARLEAARHNSAMEGRDAARLGLERQRVGLEGQRVALARQEAGSGSGGKPTGADAELVTAILANPAIYDGLTPTAKTKLAGPLSKAGFKFEGKAVGGKAAGPDVAKIFNEIETLSKRINTGEGSPMSNVAGMSRRSMAAGNMDNDVSEYQALVAGMIPMVARAVGHTGVLTQQDVDSVRALFPRVGDNKVLAQNKIKRVKSLIAGSTTTTATPQLDEKKADPLGIR